MITTYRWTPLSPTMSWLLTRPIIIERSHGAIICTLMHIDIQCTHSTSSFQATREDSQLIPLSITYVSCYVWSINREPGSSIMFLPLSLYFLTYEQHLWEDLNVQVSCNPLVTVSPTLANQMLSRYNRGESVIWEFYLVCPPAGNLCI